MNPTLCANFVVSQVNPELHEPVLWPVKARTPNTSLQHFWWPHKGDTSPRQRLVWLSNKPAGVYLRCDHEPQESCWILLLGEIPCWGPAKNRLLCAVHLVSPSILNFLRVLDKQLLANFGLMAILAVEVLSAPSLQNQDQAQVWFRYALWYIGGALLGLSTWRASSSPTCQ
jgi:hypothetical protein